MRKHATWLGMVGAVALCALAIASCGGTGGGGGKSGNPDAQFILNSNRAGRLVLNINPLEVDANKSDRIGLVATLTDSLGNPIEGTLITFTSDIEDITFIPGDVVNGRNVGFATTDSNGNADIIAVVGTTPTGTGAIVGTGAIFAQPPPAFGLRAQANVTILDVGFIDNDVLAVIPPAVTLVEPAPGQAIFFNIIGGTPPYHLTGEVSGIGTATLSQHCAPGCTENGGVLCVGSACQSDPDCGVGSPAGTCVGPIQRCLASCDGTNCAGSLCDTDADCNDGSPTPANVCRDSGQSIVYNIASADVSGTHSFTVFDSQGESVVVTVTVSFVCGNGVARGDEQCDLGDLRDQTCEGLGFVGGGTLLCGASCTFDTANCAATQGTPGGGGGATPTGPTPTGATPTPGPAITPTATAGGPVPTATAGVGVPSNLALALLTNCAGNNGNGTLTTVVAATVTDTLANPVPNGTSVTFNISGTTFGAVINSPSSTNTNPPCAVSNFEDDCQLTVLDQPGVAHTCITYPIGSVGQSPTVNGASGAASDSLPITLPGTPP